MGRRYAAVQTDLGRPVAIKVLHTEVALAADGIARFEREAKAAAALGHPNIAQVSDFQAVPGEPPFLVMELLTGSPLGRVIRTVGKLPPARMAWIAYQMLAGLDVAHRAGIVHRDIKPDNVFLVSMPGVEDLVKLVDFGIAKLAGDNDAQLTATGTMLGSPAYMAPEQVRSVHVDHRVDLYAVGATMYVALSGRMPFDAPTIHGLLLAITQERATPLHVLDPSIDPAFSALVERAMAKDPQGRFASAAEMRAALEPWIAGGHARASIASGAPVAPPIASGAAPISAAAMTGPPPGTRPPGSVGPIAQGFPPPQASVQPFTQPSAQPFAQAATPPPMLHATPAPVPARGNGAVIALLGAIALLLLIGLAGGGYFLYARQHEPSVASTPASSVAAAPPAATATATVAAGAPPTAAAASASAVTAATAKAKPVVAAAPPAQAAAPVAAATAATAADAGPSGPKQMAGTKWFIGGGTFDKYEIEPTKAAIMKMSGAITACFVATEFEPPDHQFTNWTFHLDPAGNVTSVGRTTSFQLHPRFDACMISALRQVKVAPVPGGGTLQISFTARTRDNP